MRKTAGSRCGILQVLRDQVLKRIAPGKSKAKLKN